MSLFGLIGQTVKLPFSAVSDLSNAIRGKDTDGVVSNVGSIGDEIEDMFDL